MSGPIFGVGASGQMRAEYERQMDMLANAEYLRLQVPHGGEAEPVDAGAIPLDPDSFDPTTRVHPEDPGDATSRFGGFRVPGVPGAVVPPLPGDTVVPANPRGHVLAPSIVPGLDWATGGPYRELGPTGEPPTPVAPALSMGDYIGEGARGFLLPSLVGGVVSGALAAAAARGTGLGGLAFGSRVMSSVALGLATGAGAGLLVAASSPRPGDSLAARYAVAGGLLGAAGGATYPGGASRATSALLGAVTGAIVAGFTGARLEQPA